MGTPAGPGSHGEKGKGSGLALNLLSRPQEDMQQLVRQRVESQLRRESRGTLGTPLGPRTARVPWVRFPLGRWGRWR